MNRLLLLILSFCVSNAFAESNVVRASIMLTEPWGYYEGDTSTEDKSKLKMTGIWIEISDLIEKESKVTINKTLTPYPRIWQELESGDTDISFLIRSADRESIVNHAGHLFNFGSVALSRKGVALNKYEDLAGLQIGLLRGIRLSPRFDADTTLHKIEVRDYETLVNMLREGRLDVIAGNSVSIPYLLRKLDAKDIVGQRLVLQSTPVTIHVSKRFKDKATTKRLEDAVNRLNRRGAIEKILTKWAGDDWRVK